jgi:hypothetical protein
MCNEPHGATSTSAAATAETTRISFGAPLPFYPYLEPDSVRQHADAPSARRYTPVAPRTQGYERALWVLPVRPGLMFDDDPHGQARISLLSALHEDAPEGLLPGGELAVQRFADQKPR